MSHRRKHLNGVALHRWTESRLKLCGNACEACRRPFRSNEPPQIDHDHKTGRVRGLLCRSCNFIEGTIRGINMPEKAVALHGLLMWLYRQQAEDDRWRAATMFTGVDMNTEVPMMAALIAEMQPATITALAAHCRRPRNIINAILRCGADRGILHRIGHSWWLLQDAPKMPKEIPTWTEAGGAILKRLRTYKKATTSQQIASDLNIEHIDVRVTLARALTFGLVTQFKNGWRLKHDATILIED